MTTWAENQRRRLPEFIDEAFSKLGPSLRIVPCDEEMNPLGRGGVLQASSKKDAILMWADKYPTCVFAINTGASGLDAYLYTRQMIRRGFNPSKKLMDSPCICLSYAEDVEELIAPDGNPVDYIKSFIYLVEGTQSTDINQVIGRDAPVDVPNKGLILLPRNKPIPIPGQKIVVKTKSGLLARSLVEWA